MLEGYRYLDGLQYEGWIWEFIRRNEAYQEAYATYSANRPYWNETVFEGDTPTGWRYTELFHPFGLLMPLDPTLKANDRMFVFQPAGQGEEEITPIPLIYRFDWPLLSPACDAVTRDWQKWHPDNVEVKIDVRAPMDDIKERIHQIVERARERFKFTNNYGNIDRKDFRRPRDYNNWKAYLIAFDLNKKDLAVQAIAKILDPQRKHGASCPSGCSACKKVYTALSRARELIEEEYRGYLLKLQHTIRLSGGIWGSYSPWPRKQYEGSILSKKTIEGWDSKNQK